MNNKLFDVMQRLGRAFMLPIAILPIAGILLGIGSSMTDPTTIATYGLHHILGEGTFLYTVFLVMKTVSATIFDNLPILFAIGTAIGMARREKEVAALAAVLSYIVMISAVNACLKLNGMILDDGSLAESVLPGTIIKSMGIQTLQMGIFGGIIVGLGVSVLHNRFYNIHLPEMLSFFGGRRFVPVISILVYMNVGIAMFYIWPPIQHVIYGLGQLVRDSGYPGTFLYGILKRSLLPFGLHHMLYLPFWQTAVGGTLEVGGKIIEGGQNIFFAQLADPTTKHFSAEACRYFSGEFIFMIFGLPGAALAMYQTARPEKKKQVGGLLISATLACVLTGITEPLEFSFLFTAPILFGVQVVLAGFAYMLAHILNIAVGVTFSGGLIDLFFFGILQGNAKTDWIRIIPCGVIYFLLYFGIFYTLIRKMNLKTPGREDGDQAAIVYTRGNQKSAQIVEGLGGPDNINSFDCCATRLRCSVYDGDLVNHEILNQSGCRRIRQKGCAIQMMFGPQVANILADLELYLDIFRQDSVEDEIPEVRDRHEEAALTESSFEEPDSNPDNRSNVSVICEIFNPVRGDVISLSEVDDVLLSSEVLGQGYAVVPEDGKIYAPVDGEIYVTYDTGHAIGVRSTQGVCILIHLGINTVRLHGEGFHAYTEKGCQVKKGDLIAAFSPDEIRQKGYDVTTSLIITNTDEFSYITTPKCKTADVGERVMLVGKITENNV